MALELGEPHRVETLAQQVGGEPLGGEVDETNVKPRGDLLPDDPPGALPPEGGVDRSADPLGHAQESGPLVRGLDRARDHPSRPAAKRLLQRREFGGFADAVDRNAAVRFPPRLRLESDEVEVRRVEHHRVPVRGAEDEQLVDGATLKVREVRGVDSSPSRPRRAP